MSHPKIIEDDMPRVLLGLFVATLVVVAVDVRSVRLPRVPVTVLAFLAFCGLTMLWSPEVTVTARATLYYLAMAVLGALLVANTTGRLLVRGLSFGIVLVMVLSVVAIVVGHPNATLTRGPLTVVQGLYGNRNIFAYVLVFGLCAVLADRSRTWWGRCVQVLVAASVLVMAYLAHSATGLVVCLFLVVVRLLVLVVQLLPEHRRRAGRWTIVVGSTVVTVATVVNLPKIMELLGRDATLTGRLPLWEAIIKVWSESPIGGAGWGAVWSYAWFTAPESQTAAKINALLDNPLNHGHNAVLDILVQVGAVGVLLYLAIAVVAAVRTWTRRSRLSTVSRIWVALVLVTLLLAGMTEPLFAIPLGWFHVVLIAAVAESSRRFERGSSPRRQAGLSPEPEPEPELKPVTSTSTASQGGGSVGHLTSEGETPGSSEALRAGPPDDRQVDDEPQR